MVVVVVVAAVVVVVTSTTTTAAQTAGPQQARAGVPVTMAEAAPAPVAAEVAARQV